MNTITTTKLSTVTTLALAAGLLALGALGALPAQAAPGVYWTAGPHEMMYNGTYAKDSNYYRLVADIRHHGECVRDIQLFHVLGKIAVEIECFIVFSDDLPDQQAFLRRLGVLLGQPPRTDGAEIFHVAVNFF